MGIGLCPCGRDYKRLTRPRCEVPWSNCCEEWRHPSRKRVNSSRRRFNFFAGPWRNCAENGVSFSRGEGENVAFPRWNSHLLLLLEGMFLRFLIIEFKCAYLNFLLIKGSLRWMREKKQFLLFFVEIKLWNWKIVRIRPWEKLIPHFYKNTVYKIIYKVKLI